VSCDSEAITPCSIKSIEPTVPVVFFATISQAIYTFRPALTTDSYIRSSIMGKGGKGAGAGENSKKAQGQARKANAAAEKQAAKDRQAEAAEAEEWKKGSKSNAKAYVLHSTSLTRYPY
jgi:hypothetical protein